MKAVNDVKRTLRVSICQDVSRERENVGEGPTHKATLFWLSGFETGVAEVPLLYTLSTCDLSAGIG